MDGMAAQSVCCRWWNHRLSRRYGHTRVGDPIHWPQGGFRMNAIAAAIIIGLVGLLLVGIQQYRVLALEGQVTLQMKTAKDATDANTESQKTITTLQAEAKRNANYTADLQQRLKASEDKARQATKDFEDLKRKSPAVRKWADQPLPDGLRGKGAGSGDAVLAPDLI
ncbi:hypothetical protein ALQ88_01717 [Pseudomonas savastanoi]|nr:Uncharacterized protein ALO58_02046 [Pseudomonas savastanoi pv. savastanoi]RML68313.1 hypothetical protein ALQ90_01953 [Pseudomonas savastanoi pv. savastanoi]RMM01432.1 hypothetical protein ALQ88_01717 [Pseudomonas savastanoi]RMT82585.1 hypothetical protein ALP41_100882 [Pseudomonas savastanoi pv. nerii]